MVWRGREEESLVRSRCRGEVLGFTVRQTWFLIKLTEVSPLASPPWTAEPRSSHRTPGPTAGGNAEQGHKWSSRKPGV